MNLNEALRIIAAGSSGGSPDEFEPPWLWWLKRPNGWRTSSDGLVKS
jgi:hypothetical protein